jgi:signal transduction histidine kinase
VLYANRQARVYLGLPVDEREPIPGTFLALARRQQYHEEPPEAWAGWPEQSGLDALRARYLVRPESPIARAFWLQVDVLDVPAGPDPVRLVRLRDVTAQTVSQRDLRKFHSVISHKLRTPLVGIVGGLELLAQHAPRLSSADVTHYAQIALKGAQRLRSEIDDILQYLSAPALAQGGVAFRLGDLAGMVDEIGTTLGLKSVGVSGQEELGDARTALSREGAETILWEILENAKKFHPQQSPTVHITFANSGANAARIRIRDNGLTLSPEQLAQVWSPYYQGEKYFTGEARGMGLGLPLVASLLWEVGGTCSIHNRADGPGVIIELILPLAGEE